MLIYSKFEFKPMRCLKNEKFLSRFGKALLNKNDLRRPKVRHKFDQQIAHDLNNRIGDWPISDIILQTYNS